MCLVIERDQEEIVTTTEQGEKQRLQEGEVERKRHKEQMEEMEKMKEHLTGEHSKFSASHEIILLTYILRLYYIRLYFAWFNYSVALQ